MKKVILPDDGIYYKKWNTKLVNAKELWLNGVLQTENNIHFFFDVIEISTKYITVLTVERFSPYRISDEQYAYGFLMRNYRAGKRLQKPKKENNKQIRSWKFWGTPYIKELNISSALSGYKAEEDRNVFQYLINTDDECVEFITDSQPKWSTYKNIKIEKIVAKYVIAKDFAHR